MVRKIAENGNERARMGLGMGMRKRDTHTMAVALSNYLAKLLGLFFSCFFFIISLQQLAANEKGIENKSPRWL